MHSSHHCDCSVLLAGCFSVQRGGVRCEHCQLHHTRDARRLRAQHVVCVRVRRRSSSISAPSSARVPLSLSPCLLAVVDASQQQAVSSMSALA